MTIQKKFSTLVTEHCCSVMPIIEILNLKHFKKMFKTGLFSAKFYHIFPEICYHVYYILMPDSECSSKLDPEIQTYQVKEVSHKPYQA